MHSVVPVLKSPQFKSVGTITLSSLCHFLSNLIRVWRHRIKTARRCSHTRVNTQSSSLQGLISSPPTPHMIWFEHTATWCYFDVKFLGFHWPLCTLVFSLMRSSVLATSRLLTSRHPDAWGAEYSVQGSVSFSPDRSRAGCVNYCVFSKNNQASANMIFKNFLSKAALPAYNMEHLSLFSGCTMWAEQ